MTKVWSPRGARPFPSIIVALALVGNCSPGAVQRRDATLDRRVTGDGPRNERTGDGGSGSGWQLQAEENFEKSTLSALRWGVDTYPDDGPFSDDGVYFRNRGVAPPAAYRASAALGTQGWLTIESYSRSSGMEPLSIVEDPNGSTNHVLRLSSPAHTDATVIRSTQPLPAQYRISLRVGYAEFGDGEPGNNGYDSGDETAEPWLSDKATSENGFYWLAILDAIPRPHNNVWIHHHRKVAIDSDNHYTDGADWMQIFTGSGFEPGGAFPVLMFGIDGTGQGYVGSGKPFYSYAGGSWQPSGQVRAADAYKPSTWYQVSIERRGNSYTLKVSGDFRHGGQQTYTGTMDAAARCVWHYNNAPLPAESPCIDTSSYPEVGADYSNWPADGSWPDYFMFGDPHNNFYEGYVYYDDIRLEVWR